MVPTCTAACSGSDIMVLALLFVCTPPSHLLFGCNIAPTAWLMKICVMEEYTQKIVVRCFGNEIAYDVESGKFVFS